jgi:hypothetical protein
MLQLVKKFLNIGALVLLLGSSMSLNATTVKALTSKKSAKKVAQQLPTASFATGLKKHSFGLGIGQMFLRGGFADHASNKMSVDLYYNYGVSYTFDLLTNLHYNESDKLGNSITLQGITTAIKFKLYQIDEFSPFVLGGLGIYYPEESRYVDGTLKKANAAATMGWNFGFGADLRLNDKFTIGMLFHYHDPFDVEQDIGPNIRGAYSKLLVTLLYTVN